MILQLVHRAGSWHYYTEGWNARAALDADMIKDLSGAHIPFLEVSIETDGETEVVIEDSEDNQCYRVPLVVHWEEGQNHPKGTWWEWSEPDMDYANSVWQDELNNAGIEKDGKNHLVSLIIETYNPES